MRKPLPAARSTRSPSRRRGFDETDLEGPRREMIYLDTSYIVKCYAREPGTVRVLKWLEGQFSPSCCSHGRIEFFAAVKRHVGEGRLSRAGALQVSKRLEADEDDGLWNWIPVTEALIRDACGRIARLSDRVFLRAADALHLTCAAESGFHTVYSHDRRFLDAAAHFGLEGVDILQEAPKP